MEGGENKKRKAPIELDWKKLLPQHDKEPPPQLIVATTVGSPEQPHFTPCNDDNAENLAIIPDAELDRRIGRQRSLAEIMCNKLADKGEKIRKLLSRLEEEKDRRKNLIYKEDAGVEKPKQSPNPNYSLNGASRGFRQGTLSAPPQSRFELKSCQEANSKNVNTCGKNYTDGPHVNFRKRRSNKQFPASGKSNSRKPFVETNLKGHGFHLVDIDKRSVLNGARKSRCVSRNIKEDMSVNFSKRHASKVYSSNNLRSQVKTVVQLDEEEPQLVETRKQEEEYKEEEVDDSIKASKICYPSRNDPESIEIFYADMECLAPGTYLSSTIMNFYIRYLQQTTTDRTRCGYHFFTTYFYEKLKEDVLNKTTDEEKLFVKFRRWWKSINIFEKAYILIPIHECHHWSLVIICIPDKEDESGLILLHLDSLGVHCSRSIFENVRSFLKKEWSYLKQEDSLQYPLEDNIWQNLPYRIDEIKLTVPQQRNEYDCGLFVLFFMGRFIEEVPHRLKREDLAMFGKHWFNPKEASDLRLEIRRILMKFFKRDGDRSKWTHDSFGNGDVEVSNHYVTPRDYLGMAASKSNSKLVCR